MKLFDAHNHLQDPRLDPVRDGILKICLQLGIAASVMNGSCEDDWPDVLSLAARHPQLIPAFGYHPWYVGDATPDWKDRLTECLDSIPSTVGEIGLDRWKKDLDFELQKSFFIAQLEIATERQLPVSIHCLEAWGPLIDILSSHPLPERGFLLHSYSGSVEMVPQLAKLGAYFSCAGNYLSPKKQHKLELFRHVPSDRLLLETDAPDQLLPLERDRFAELRADPERAINHPANLIEVYTGVAQALQMETGELARRVESNFAALFGPWIRRPTPGEPAEA